MRTSEKKVEALRGDIARILQVFKVEEALDEEGPGASLNVSDLAVISLLGERGACIMREIADVLWVALSTATSIVDRLVRQDLVHRERVEEDRRIVRLGLTAKGQALHGHRVAVELRNTRVMLAALEAGEQDTLVRLMAKIAQAAEQHRAAARRR